MAEVLHNYVVDTVRLAKREDGSPAVQMVSWTVAAATAASAFERFSSEGAGEILFEGELVDFVIVGITQAT